MKLRPAWVLCCAPHFPRLRLDRVSETGTALFPFLAPAALAYPAILPQSDPPNLELYPLANSTSFAEPDLHREKREPRCYGRGSCHHNLNDPSLFVPPQQSSLFLSSCDTLNTFQLPIRQTPIQNFVASQHQHSQASSLVNASNQRYPTRALFAGKSDPSSKHPSQAQLRSRWSRPVRHHNTIINNAGLESVWADMYD